MNYPHQVQGRITDETLAQMQQAIARFKATEGALVRAAMEDYLPRFLANQGQPEHAELFAQLAVALREKPEIETDLKKFARVATRRARSVAAA